MILRNNMNTPAPEGIPEKMKKTLSDLIEASKLLQETIIRRDVSNVWKILSFQQEKITEFEQYNALWEQIYADGGMKNSEKTARAKDEISSEYARLRRINTSNASLIQSFLAAIRKAMKKATQNTGSHSPVYGSKGKMKIKQSSLMINSVG